MNENSFNDPSIKGIAEFIEQGKNGFIFFRSDAGDMERIFKNIIANSDKSRATSFMTEYIGTVKMTGEDVPAVYDLITIFTHLNEKSQDEFLSELHRVCRPGGYLFLTVHGEQALSRAINEKRIREMISVDEDGFQNARSAFAEGRHAFIPQEGHLKKLINEPFEYGITFIPEQYIMAHWSRWFDIKDYRHGAIHKFQDIVVLTPKK